MSKSTELVRREGRATNPRVRSRRSWSACTARVSFPEGSPPMFDTSPTNQAACVPAPIRPPALRAGFALVVFVAMVAFAARAVAQVPTIQASASAARVPFAVGEELVFRATFGILPAGTARMRVAGIDTV